MDSGFEPWAALQVDPLIYVFVTQLNNIYFLKKLAIPRLFFFYFRLLDTIHMTVENECSIKFCQCLDTNHGPLVSEATALPTEPQPRPIK